MDFPGLDLPRIARALALISPGSDELVEAFFERSEEVEVAVVGDGPGMRVRREDGFALRLGRGDRIWSASRDGLSQRSFATAYRQVARSQPVTPVSFGDLVFSPWPEMTSPPELLALPSKLQSELRARRVGFPLQLSVRRHRRWVQVLGNHLAPAPEAETYYSLAASLPGGRYGTLLGSLEDCEGVAEVLVELFRSREAEPPPRSRGAVVLGPPAAAVFLHEAVAHTLEADVLALTGDPRAALGLELGSNLLDLLDDPAEAPVGVRRRTDDEGVPVVGRWLLRGGRVEQLLADRQWAERIEGATPGAGRRADRHSEPGPRSLHLQLLAGSASEAELFAGSGGGLYLQEASRGKLDPLSGTFWVEAPYARRFTSQGLGERVGACRLRARVGEVLKAVSAVGREARSCGAGWCAKSGHRLPVWATTPAIRLEDVEVTPA